MEKRVKIIVKVINDVYEYVYKITVDEENNIIDYEMIDGDDSWQVEGAIEEFLNDAVKEKMKLEKKVLEETMMREILENGEYLPEEFIDALIEIDRSEALVEGVSYDYMHYGGELDIDISFEIL